MEPRREVRGSVISCEQATLRVSNKCSIWLELNATQPSPAGSYPRGLGAANVAYPPGWRGTWPARANATLVNRPDSGAVSDKYGGSASRGPAESLLTELL